MSDSDYTSSLVKNDNNVERDADVTESNSGLLGSFIGKYYKQILMGRDENPTEEIKRNIQSNDAFYTGRTEEGIELTTTVSNTDLISKLVKENLDLREQLTSKIDLLDATINTHRTQYEEEITNLKSLVHSFMNMNDKKNYDSEINSLKIDFKRLHSEFDRVVDANRNLNDSLQRDVNLLSSTTSENQKQLQRLFSMSMSMPSLHSLSRESAIMGKFETDFEMLKSQMVDLIEQKISNHIKEIEDNVKDVKFEIMDSVQSNVEEMMDSKMMEISSKMDEINDTSINVESNNAIEALVNDKFENIKKANKKLINDIEVKMMGMNDQIYTDINKASEYLYQKIESNISAKLTDIDGKIEKTALSAEENKKLISDIGFKANRAESSEIGDDVQEEVAKLSEMVNITASTIQSLKNVIDDLGNDLYEKIAELKSSSGDQEGGEDVGDLRLDFAFMAGEISDLKEAVKSIDPNQRRRDDGSSDKTKAEFVKIGNRIDGLEAAIEENVASSQTIIESVQELEQAFEDKIGTFSGEIDHFSTLILEYQNVLSEMHSSLDERIGDLDSRIESVAQDKKPDNEISIDVLKSEIETRVSDAKQDMVGILQEVFSIVNKYQEQISELNEYVGALVDDEQFKGLERLVSLYGNKLENTVKKLDTLSNRCDSINNQVMKIEKNLEGLLNKEMAKRLESVPSMQQIESRVNDLMMKKLSNFDINSIQDRLNVLENEIIPTFSETINELMDSALNNISTEIINKSVEKVIYEILEKLERRVSSIRGIKDSVKAPGEISVESVHENVHSIPSVKIKPQNIKSQPGEVIKPELLEKNKMMIEQFSKKFTGEISSLNDEITELRGEFDEFKNEMSSSFAQIFNTIHSNNSRIEERLKDAESSEARAAAIFSRIEENSAILEEKIKNINDTIQSGSKTIKKLNSLVKKSKDSAKNFEKLNFERIWTEKLSAERDQQDHQSPDGNFMGFEPAQSDDDNRYTIDYYNTSPGTKSPVIERYIVPVGETQVAVTRQYVEMPELQYTTAVQCPVNVLDNDQTVYLQYEDNTNQVNYGYESPDMGDLSPGNQMEEN